MRKLEMEDGRPTTDIGRRDVLRAVATSVVVAAGSVMTRGAASADDVVPVATDGKMALKSQPLMTVRIAAAPQQNLGPVPHGVRIIVPVTGGDFEGPRLRGQILPGGDDWLLLRSDGVLELDLRITLKTDDHALIYMTFQGLRHGPPDVIAALTRGEAVDPHNYYFRTVPKFETSSEKYAFLNRMITVARGETRADGAVHEIDEIL